MAALASAMRGRRPGGQLAGPGQRRLVELVGLDDPVDAGRSGSASSARTWRPEKIRSLARDGADQAGQPLGAAAAGDDAEQDLGLAELGLGGADAEVARQRQLAAAAEGEAGDRRRWWAGAGRPAALNASRNRPPMLRASSGPANSLMSAPAAKIRSPPVTTTAPGRLSFRALDRGPELAQHLRRDGVHLGVLQRERRPRRRRGVRC